MIGIMTAIAASTVYSIATGATAGVAGVVAGVVGTKLVQNKKHPEIKEANKAAKAANKAAKKAAKDEKKVSEAEVVEAEVVEADKNVEEQPQPEEKINKDSIVDVEPQDIKEAPKEEAKTTNNTEKPQPNPALNLNIDPATGTPVQENM